MRIRKGYLVVCFAILIMGSGWFVFSRYIRPNHYQLLFPYTKLFGKMITDSEVRTGRDGRLQILIPAGVALLGKDRQEAELSAFWVDQIPVRLKDFKRYTAERKVLPAKYRDEYAKDYSGWFNELKPVVFVGWEQAEAYCEYYGGHLPTEAQWEKAARGTDGVVLYWDDDTKSFDHANYDNFYNGTTPAGWLMKGKTAYGVLDMSGNVREWVIDPFRGDDHPIRLTDWETLKNKKDDGTGRILKGGSFSDDLSHLRFDFRDAHDPNSPGVNRGFRCVYEADTEITLAKAESENGGVIK